MAKAGDDDSMPIAVIGMGCRFPADATSPEHLWELLVNGRNAWSEFPKDRINIDGFYHPSGGRQGSICFRGGHFLRDDIAAFDAPFFSTTAHEAAAMDPQQRILLEVSYEAFENAGIPIETLPGSSTAVYCGSFVKDYEQICLRDPDDSPQYAATGNGIAIMSNRISWFYDLRGPSMTIDTGCSASLVGVHLACQSLRMGEWSLAIAMGAGLILTPSTMLPMTALNFLSPDGKCFAFDERANGYGRGEGIGAVVLKPLHAALRDNDTIRAVIRGSGVNQDGRTPGITMPSKDAQAMNIRAVYKAAGLGYDRTAYFEAHGTGTQAGDPTELGAISETFAETRNPDDPIFVGSVKTNIGHLEGCAGIAGLVKGVLMLEKGLIPPNLYFENVNPRIPLDDWKIKIPKEVTPWPVDGLRRVSINCFGFGGTNAHIILDDAFHYLSERGIQGNHCSLDFSHPSTPSTSDSGIDIDKPPSDSELGWNPWTQTRRAKIYVLSSHEENGIARLATEYSRYLEEKVGSELSVRELDGIGTNIAYTLACRRTKLPWKAFVVCSSTGKLQAHLLDNLSKPLRSSEAPNVAFVFSGQGAQWFAMGRELLQYQYFLNSLDEADRYIKSIGSECCLMTELLKDEDRSLIDLPRISQPLCTALQVALVDLLDHWGVKPYAVVGHSSGEIAAAYCLGAISRQDAWKLAYHRGRLTNMIKFLAPNQRGRMIAVALSQRNAETLISRLTLGKVVVACINSPESVTISGDEKAILELEKYLVPEGIFARVLKVENAYHSYHMKIIEQHYLEAISSVRTMEAPPGTAMFSSVTGNLVCGNDLGPSYWARNLVSPVKFSGAVSSLVHSKATKPDILLEIGPHAVLQGPLNQILEVESKLKSRATCLSMLYRGKDALTTSLEAVGNLWARGCPADLAKANRTFLDVKPQVLTDLPAYPWNHAQTYWHESHLGSAHRFRKWGRQDLIGAPTADSITFEPRWRGFLRVSENPWIQDHQVQNTIIYPAAGMISMVFQSACQMQDENRQVDTYEIAIMSIEKAMIIPTSAHGLETALNIKARQDDAQVDNPNTAWFEFTVYSKLLDASWVKNCHGLLGIHYKSPYDTVDAVEEEFLRSEQYREEYLASQRVCTQTISPRQLYETLESIGMKYGPMFQNISSVRKKDNVSCTTVRIPDTKSRMPAKYEYPHLIHPATLDAMFQTVFVAGNEPMVPSFLKSLTISADFPQGVGRQLEGYSVASRRGLRDAMGTIVMSDGSWQKPMLVVKDLHFKALSTAPEEFGESGFLPNHHNLCAELTWKENFETAKPGSFSEWLDLLLYKHPDHNILEISGGGGNLTASLLKIIGRSAGSTPRFSRYTFTDTNSANFEQLQRRLSEWNSYIDFKTLKANEDLSKQGFNDRIFDLIIARDTNHGSLGGLRRLLKPSGRLVLVEAQNIRCAPICNAITEIDMLDPVEHDGTQQRDLNLILELAGYSGVEKLFASDLGEDGMTRSIIISPYDNPSSANLPPREFVLLLPQNPSVELRELSAKTADALLLLGVKTTTTELVNSSQSLSGKICLSFLEVDTPLLHKWTSSEFDGFRTMVANVKGCLWMTRGGQMNVESPSSSLINTLFRTIRSEDPQKNLYTLDFDPFTALDSDSTGQAIISTILASFDSNSTSEEMEYAERGGKLMIPRIMLQKQLSERIDRGDVQAPRVVHFHQVDRPLQLEVGAVGNLDSLRFIDDPEPSVPLDPHDVEIQVQSATIDSSDGKTALGQTSANSIGSDVAGVISRVGSLVSKFKPGDIVVSIVRGAFKTFVRSHESLVQMIPDNMPLETVAYIPSSAVVAYYSIITLGRLQAGESVLIHAGAGPVAQIAIQIAKDIGAEIYAMVHSIEDRRMLVDFCRVRNEHILDYSSTSFDQGILRLTGQRRVDLVIDSLNSDKIKLSWNCVAEFGRFIDISNNDAFRITGPSTRTGSHNITYSSVNLDHIFKRNKPLLSRLLQSAFDVVRANIIRSPTPSKTFPLSQISKAFQEATASTHGKVVVRFNGSASVPIMPRVEHPLELSPDATYVLAGGLGGLGRSLSGLLVKHGAKHLAFFSRSGAVSEEQVNFLNDLKRQGIDGRPYACDICDKAALEATIKSCGKEMPAIRGVIQGAAVIRDAIFDNMTYDDWVAATRPKIQGSQNLHELMPQDLDFFVLLSSSAGVIGARGQANYAVGNTFQDALAAHRRSKGLKAVSLDLGLILGAGMVAEDEATLDMLRSSGFFGIREKDFHLLVSAAITGYASSSGPHLTPSQVIIGTGTGGLVKQNQVSDPYWYREAMFSHMARVDLPPTSSATSDSESIPGLLAACESLEEAADIIIEGLVTLLAKSMNMLPADLDAGKPANHYGVDSLVAVGTRNWIFRETSVDVSVFEILSEGSMRDLAGGIAGKCRFVRGELRGGEEVE